MRKWAMLWTCWFCGKKTGELIQVPLNNSNDAFKHVVIHVTSTKQFLSLINFAAVMVALMEKVCILPFPHARTWQNASLVLFTILSFLRLLFSTLMRIICFANIAYDLHNEL